jgi:hypothetical protein
MVPALLKMFSRCLRDFPADCSVSADEMKREAGRRHSDWPVARAARNVARAERLETDAFGLTQAVTLVALAKLNLTEVSCPHGESRAEAGRGAVGVRSARPRRIGGHHDD